MTDTPPAATDLGKVVAEPAVRQAIYGGYVVLLALLGAVSAGFAALHAGFPDWLIVANAAVAYLGIPIGGLAAAHVTKARK